MPWDGALPDRLDLARLQTPIVPLPRLSQRLGGPALWVKRDDQTGATESGNKIRKLQYTVAEAQRDGVDTLITCGGLQSNHARTTVVVARRLGLDVELFLRGESPPRAEGNLLLDAVLGARIHMVSVDAYGNKDAMMDARADELRAQGRRPLVVAEGCSMPSGCWGYIEAMQEVVQAQATLGVTFDAIVSGVGSGGTAAGIELGARLFNFSGDVVGVPVCDSEAFFREKIGRLCAETIERYGLPVTVPPEDIGLLGGYIGGGYGVSAPHERDTLVDLARTEGIVLEPVYSGKAFHALVSELDGRFAGMKNVLFLHTGGVFGLAAYADALPGPDVSSTHA
ncbi:MAG: D-cysteine desulfhydrase family protein [Myxococcota bacterium]